MMTRLGLVFVLLGELVAGCSIIDAPAPSFGQTSLEIYQAAQTRFLSSEQDALTMIGDWQGRVEVARASYAARSGAVQRFVREVEDIALTPSAAVTAREDLATALGTLKERLDRMIHGDTELWLSEADGYKADRDWVTQSMARFEQALASYIPGVTPEPVDTARPTTLRTIAPIIVDDGQKRAAAEALIAFLGAYATDLNALYDPALVCSPLAAMPKDADFGEFFVPRYFDGLHFNFAPLAVDSVEAAMPPNTIAGEAWNVSLRGTFSFNYDEPLYHDAFIAKLVDQFVRTQQMTVPGATSQAETIWQLARLKREPFQHNSGQSWPFVDHMLVTDQGAGARFCDTTALSRIFFTTDLGAALIDSYILPWGDSYLASQTLP